jgi:hypothetical protein
MSWEHYHEPQARIWKADIMAYFRDSPGQLSLYFFLTEHHAMKAYWGMEVISMHSLTSALDGGEWSVSRTGRFTPGENPWYRLDWRLSEPQSRSGRGGEEKNSQPPPGIEP